MKKTMLLFLLFFQFQSLLLAIDPHEFESWLSHQETISTERLYNNISRPDTLRGIVVASPSKSNPNYYWHWVRDAALVMDVVRSQMTSSLDPVRSNALKGMMIDWVNLVRKLQVTPNRSSGVGEPKFNVDGTAFNGDWGRPQNDGPALRAYTLTKFANSLLEQGEEQYVRTNLYAGKMPAQGAIKKDLEYVAHSLNQTDFDPWEEVRGYHFYNRMVQRKSLREGAKLARRMGDEGAAHFYDLKASYLEQQLLGHWNPTKKIFEVTLGRDGGADYKHSGIDTAVILAFLHTDEDDFIALDDSRVTSTAHVIRETFQRLYPINKNGLPGTLIGRYPEDHYDGNGFSEGNGWVLLTHAMAEYYYRLADKLNKQGYVQIDDLARDFYTARLQESKLLTHQLQVRSYDQNSSTFNNVVTALKVSGDHLMQRVKYHTPVDGSFSEQINRHTGFMRGAPDLTWSYASFLTAVRERQKLN